MIDLGHEPPLSVDGSEAAVIDRRRVSVQWFSGTILTGLMRRSSHRRRRFCVARRRNDVCHGCRSGSKARCAAPSAPMIGGQPAQERPPAAAGRGDRRAQRRARLHRHPRRQPRRDAGAAVRSHLRQPVDDDERSVREDSALQRPAHADRCRHARRPHSDDADANADAAEPDAEVSFVTKDLGTVLPKAKISRRGRAR